MNMRDWLPASVAYLLFIALAIAAHGRETLPIDSRIANRIEVQADTRIETVADGISWSMRSLPVAVVAVAMAVVLAWNRRFLAAAFLLAIVPVMYLSYPLKELVASPRPGGVEGDWGFPAGRAGNALFLAGALAIAATWPGRKWRWSMACVWVGVVGWARVATGAQWPSDVAGAWLWSAPTLAGLAVLFRTAHRNECAIYR